SRKQSRRSAPVGCPSFARRRSQPADDSSAGPPFRGDPGAEAGAGTSCRLGDDRCQSGQARVDNPQRRYTEKRPFDTWAEIAAVAAKLGPLYGPMVIFAAATGLRQGEWIALEKRDIDREARVAYVRRAYRNGRLKCTKTEASVRAVPLQAIALAVLEQMPADKSSALPVPSPRGGHLDLPNSRNRDWKPAQRAAGVTPRR